MIQQGEAMDVYREPSHRRAMELVGFPKANLLPIANGAGAQAVLLLATRPAASICRGAARGSILGEAGQLTAKAEVQLIEELGAKR